MVRKLLSSLSNKNKRLLCLVVIYLVVLEGLFVSLSFTAPAPGSNSMDKHFMNLDANLDSLADNVKNNGVVSRSRILFTNARAEYKHIEMIIEYVYPFYAKFYINGPPNLKHDLENGNKVFGPHGFQFLEPFFFANDTASKAVLLEEINILRETLNRSWKKYKSVVPSGQQYFDMMQLEIIRLVSMDINGYDCAVTKQNITESVGVLSGIEEMALLAAGTVGKHSLPVTIQEQFNKCRDYLVANPDYDSFNRLYFITVYIKPLYSELCKLRNELNIGRAPVKYAINFKENRLFGPDFYNRDYFSVNISDSSKRKQQAELGRLLFFDPILSQNNKRACASCHKPEFGFADTVKYNFEFNRLSKLERNTPSLLNVMYQRSFFYDGRSLQMEDQVSDVLHAIKEMNSNPALITTRLKDSPGYIKLFKNAFKGTEDTSVTFYAVLKAVSEFEKTLVVFNSRFDQYLQGNTKSLTPEEINGYNLFAGKALCGTCHFTPLFNGTTPPVYAENEFEVIGTTTGPDSKIVDADSGRYHVTKKEIHIGAFKTPGLRNSKYSKPYMHNGAFNTLDEVIEFYNKGGGAVAIQKPGNQTLPFDSLQLSKKEKADIKSFLLSLSGSGFKNLKPASLPSFKTKEWNKRKVGGEY